MLTAIHTQAEVRAEQSIEVAIPGVPPGTTVEVIVLIEAKQLKEETPAEATQPDPLQRMRQLNAFRTALGLLKTQSPPPTDEEVEQIIHDARMEKYS